MWKVVACVRASEARGGTHHYCKDSLADGSGKGERLRKTGSEASWRGWVQVEHEDGPNGGGLGGMPVARSGNVELELMANFKYPPTKPYGLHAYMCPY